MISFGIGSGLMPLLTHSNKPFTSQSVLVDGKKFRDHLQNCHPENLWIHREFMLATVPSILVDLAMTGPEAMRELGKTAGYVMYAGGGLSVEVGDMLAEHGINIFAGYGS
jgi:hypothetical protein